MDVADQRRKVDILIIHFIDDNHPAHVGPSRLLEHAARVDFDPRMSVDHDQRGVGRLQGPDELANEIWIAGRIKNVKVLARMLKVSQGSFDRVLVLFFCWIEIADAGPVVDARSARDGFG